MPNKSTEAVNTEADAFAALLNNGYFELRTGTQPASADDAATGTLLGTINLNNPAFTGSAIAGVLTLDVPVSTTAGDNGTATWGRFYKNGGGAEMDVSVSEGGGGGEVIILQAVVASGETITITSFTYTIPK